MRVSVWVMALLLCLGCVFAQGMVSMKMDGNNLQNVNVDVTVGKSYTFTASGSGDVDALVVYVKGENLRAEGVNPSLQFTPHNEQVFELDVIGYTQDTAVASQKFYLNAQGGSDPGCGAWPSNPESQINAACNYLLCAKSVHLFMMDGRGIKVGFKDVEDISKAAYKGVLAGEDAMVIFTPDDKALYSWFGVNTDKTEAEAFLSEKLGLFYSAPATACADVVRGLSSRLGSALPEQEVEPPEAEESESNCPELLDEAVRRHTASETDDTEYVDELRDVHNQCTDKWEGYMALTRIAWKYSYKPDLQLALATTEEAIQKYESLFYIAGSYYDAASYSFRLGDCEKTNSYIDIYLQKEGLTEETAREDPQGKNLMDYRDQCELTAETSCQKVPGYANEDKRRIDVVFMADGYTTLADWKTDVGYAVVQGVLRDPVVDAYRDSLNFHYWEDIRTSCQVNGDEGDELLSCPDLELVKATCEADHVFVLSKSEFRSYAYFYTNTFISLPYSIDWKRTVTHEAGHAIFGLTDEYTEEDCILWGLICFDAGDKCGQGHLNCACDIGEARAKWDFIEGVSYQEGCGLDDDNIRGSVNSYMRHQSTATSFEAVNHYYITQYLEAYKFSGGTE